MGKTKNKLLIILMLVVLLATACGLLLSACVEDTFTVVLDANGGSFEGGGTTLVLSNLKAGDSIDLSLYAPTRGPEYELEGWVDNSDNEYGDDEMFVIPKSAKPGSSIVLSAQWSTDSGESLSALQVLNHIIAAMTNGDNLHSEYSTTLSVPDGSGKTTKYSIEFASNVKRGITGQGEYDYDIGFVVRDVTNNKGVMGIYVTDEYGVPGGLYVDTDPDDPEGSVFLLEDFNADYLLALVEKAPSVVPDAINGLLAGLMPGLDLFNIILGTALKAEGSLSQDDAGNNVYTMSFNPRALTDLGSLIDMVAGLVPALSSLNLSALFSYLDDIIPDSTFTLTGTVDKNGNLIKLGTSFVNHETGEALYDIENGAITITDRNEEHISLIPSKVQNHANTYSFGHIQMSAAVKLGTQQASGGAIDIASLINTFVPGTLPEGILTLDADLDYRLDLAIDLDIAQKPYSEGEDEENIKDESVIAIEIKDNKTDAVMAGVYYKEGYIYVNIGQVLGGLTGATNVWQGKGFKIPFDLPSLIKAVKDVAIKYIDGFFGTDHGMITGETDTEALSSVVTGLAMAQDGNVYISQDWANLIGTVLAVLKINGGENWVDIVEGSDYDTLTVTIDKALIDSVLKAVAGFGADISSVQIPDFGTGTIAITSGADGLRDLTIGFNSGGLDLQIMLDKLTLVKPIEKGDKTFAEYVDGVIGEGEYTSSINDLVMSTLSGGLKGSIGLDVSFNEGTYNIGDLLAVFGLDLGDLRIEVESNPKLDLTLEAGIAIDETDYAKSSLYLKLNANENFTLASEGEDYIIKEGTVLGIYLYNNEIIIDVSGLTILGIKLPVYKISSEDLNAAELIATLLANIPEMDLAIDLSGVIESLEGAAAEQASLAASVNALSGGNGTVVRSSARAANNDLINITAHNDLLQVTATLTAVLNMLDMLGLNIDFDASQFLQGEASIDISFENGALTANVSGDLLMPEEGGNSDLSAEISLDLKNDWQIGGEGLAKTIADTVEDSLPEGWESAGDALLDGLIDTLFNSTLELSLTVPDGEVAITNLLGEVFALIPNMSVDLDAMFSALDLGIVSEQVTLAIRAELYKKDGVQAIKLAIAVDDNDASTPEEPIVEVMLTHEDILYINLDYFGLGKYQVVDVGLMGLLDNLLSGLSEDLSLGSLLGGLIDFSGGLNFKAYNNGSGAMLRWNKYGAASSVYYKVYAGEDASAALVADTGADDQTGLTAAVFDEQTGIYSLALAQAAEQYFIQVYTKLPAAAGAEGKEQTMFDAAAETQTYAPDSATASYTNINAVTFTWQAKDPFGGAETYALYDANGEKVTDIVGATYDASTFTYTYTVDLTGKTGPYAIYVNGASTFAGITPVMIEQGQSVGSITVSISEMSKTATWASVAGATFYVVTATASDGSELWSSKVNDNGKAFNNVMWGGDYTGYTVTVTAYASEGGDKLAEGSASASASGGILDTIAPLLSALAIKGNVISLNLTRELVGELISTLTGGSTVTLVDLNITKLDIFNGSLDLTLGIYEDASMDDGDGYNISGSLSLSTTGDEPEVDKGDKQDYSDYKDINLLYGAGLTESVIGILSDGISIEADLNINVAAGDYNVVNIIGPFLPDSIADYLGDELIWTVGTNASNIEVDLGVYANLDESDLDKSGFMVRIAFPNGVSLSSVTAEESELVAGNGFIIRKGAAITVAVTNNTLIVDLSAITILGVTLPIYKIDNFDLAEFVEGYLVQLEQTVANMYNDNNGMMYLADKSSVTAGADKVDFKIAFDYIGEPEFEVVYFDASAENAAEVLLDAESVYDEETTTHTVSGSYNVAAAAGDYIAVYALDTLGNRYDCLKLVASGEAGAVTFAPAVSAQTLAFANSGRFENYINIDPTKLQLIVTSQAIFSLLAQVVDIPASISTMEFDVEIGVGEPNEGAEKSIWANLNGTFDGKAVSLGLSADIGIGGEVDGMTIPEFIQNEFGKVPNIYENEYPTKLLSGILDEVLTSKLTLSLTAKAAEAQGEAQGFDLLGVVNQLVGGLVSFGDTTLDLIAELDGEPVGIDLELALDGKMAESDVDLNMISLKVNYVTSAKTTTLIGIYVYQGSVWLDLSGIGMGAVEVEASGTIEKLTAYLGGLIDGLNINGTKINMDLGSILDLIAEGGTYPFGDALSPVESVAGADGDASADTADTTKNIVRAIVAMVSVEYANIKIDVQKTIINELLSLVQGASLSLNAEAEGYLDIFAGKGEIEATIRDSVSNDGAELKLMLGLEIGKTPASAAADLGKHIETLKAVTIDLDDMDGSVVNLLNAFDASLDLNVTAKGGTTDIWKLVGPIIDNVVSSGNQNVVDALEALKEQGVDWTINATDIQLSLALASDLKLDESGALDLEESALAVGIIAQTPLALGDSSPILDKDDGIYISIYKGNLYIDLSDVKLLGLEFPVLKVENFDVMSYLNDIVNMVSDKVGELLAQLPAEEQAAAMLALAEGDESAVDTSASLELRSDLTLTVALGAITQILKDTSIIDLTGLNYLPWEIELTTAAGEGNQLKLSLNNTQIEDSAYEGTGLEASLTLSAGFRELDVKDTNDLRNTLITYVRGNGTDEKPDVATRFENYSGDLINEVLNSVLGSSLTLELGGSSEGDTFDLKYALNGILDLLGMEGIADDSGYFNIDTSAGVKYRLNLILDGSADDLSALKAYIGIEMKSGSETEWETAIGIYLNNGDVYLDLTAIRNGALGGGVIKVTGSSIMDLAESEISKLLSSINVDLNELLKLTYDPDWNKPVDEQANAPSLSVSSMPIGTLVKYLVQIVSLQDLGVALNAHTTILQELTEALFGTKIDFVEASGNLLLVDGTLDLDVKIGSAAFGGETKPENVYTFGAKLAINPDGNATFNEKFDLKGKGVTELDLTSGATLSETIVGLLGNLSLDLNVDLDLPGGVFGIGDLLNSFGIVDGGLTDSNGLDLIFEPLYKNDSISAQGGMKLGLTLSLRLALDYNDPENTLAMLNLSFDEDLVMGIGEDGNDKVVIESGDLLTVIIDGTDLYVDMSNLTLLGITMPAYHASNFDISSFVTYVLDNALENTDLIIYGDIYVGCESVENGVQVSWSPVSGADEYVVSYTTAAGEEKEQTVKHDEKTTKYTLTITDALPEVYEVTVTAYEVITGEGDKEERVFIKSGTGTNSFSIASAPQANEEGEGGFIVSWNRVPGADMYYIYLNGSEDYAQQTALSVWVPEGTTEVKIVPQAFDEKGEAYKPIEGVIGRIVLGGQSEQSSFAEGDDEGAASTIRDPFELTENEAMFIGVTKNDIAAIVSFTAVEAFLNLFGLEADLGNYDATIDLTISRDDVDESGNEDWMKLHFVGTLDEDMYYEGAQTEGTVTISNVAIGGTPKWMREVKFKADMIAQNAENAGNMLIEGIIEQVLNLSASLELKVEAENMLAIGNILAYIFEQTDLDLELGDIMLDLKGLNVGIDLNLAIDPDDHANSKFTAEISDAGSDEKLIGLYLVGYDVVLDLSGISLGRFAVTDSGLPDLIYGIVDDLLTTISEIDIDLDTIVDTLYGLVDDAFSGSSDNTNEQSLAVPEFNVTGALSGYGFGKQGDKYVNVSVNGDITTFTWSRYLGGTHYVVELYNGYDNAKVNLIEQALTDTATALGGVIVDGDLILPANVTSVSVQTSVLNNIGLIADAGSKYNGAEYPAYYVFLVRAGSYNSDTEEFTPSVLSGKEVYASATNFTLLKTIMGMIKIRNGALEVDARAVMVDKLLRGALGIAFDWANAKVTAEITSGKASINISISDGDPEEYVATESTALPEYAAADENAGTAETLTYTWTLTEDQAKAQSFTFELRERNGDTANYGKYINLNSETAAEGATWTRGEGESGEHTLKLTLDLSKFTWLKDAHRADASKTNLDMAQHGELPLRLTAYYDVNTANVNGALQLGSDGAEKAEEAITAGSDPVYTKGTDGSLTLNPNIQNISLMDNASLIDSVKELMNGFRLGAELKIYISEGVYDMGGLLSQLLTTVGVSVEGLDEVTTLNWTISEPFVFRLGLELLIELGESAEDTRIALTLESDGLIIDDQNAINPGTLLGVYYTGKNVLVDLTNFKIAGITLPAYTLDIDLFDLLDTMLGDMIGGLDISAVSGGFKATADKDGVTVKGDTERYAKFEVLFNGDETGTEIDNAENGVLVAAPEAGKAYTAIVKAYGKDGRLLGSTTVSYDPATATPETGEVEGASLAPEDGTSELTNVEAIILGISSERIALEASFGAIATLLSSALSGNATVATVADVLDMLGLEIGLTMAKNEDLTLALSGLLNWNSIDGSDAEFTETTVEATNVKFDSAHSSGNTVAFSFTTVAGASGYTATMSGPNLTQPVTGTIENGIAYFNDEKIDYTTAANGGYTVTVEGKIDAPINIELSLGTSQLLGADKGEISGELDAIFGTETTEGSLDFDAKLEEYGSKVLSGLIDTLLNTRITLSLNMGMLMEDGTLDHGKVSLSDLVMLIAGDIAVSAGITLEDIVGSVDLSFEMDVTTLVLDIAMNLDLDEPESSDLLVQICSDINGVKDVLIGLYVYDNLLTLDLRALGLRAYTLQNFDYIVNLQNMLKEALLGDENGEGGLLGQYDIDLNELISDLLNPDDGQQGEETGDDETVTPPVNAAPALPEEDETIASIGIGVRNKVADGSTTFTWGAVAGVDHYMLTATAIDGTVLLNIPDISSTVTEYTITGEYKSQLIKENGWDEDIFGKIYTVKIEAHNTLGDELHNVIGKGERQLNGAIASILGAVSMENTIIGLEVTPLIINNLLAAIAPSISINTDPINVGATVDVFNGNASAEIDLSLTYSDGGAESSTFRLGATLGIGTADELYSSAADADNEINGILDELGEDVDTIDFGTPSEEAGVDGARILYALIEALNTTDVTAHLNVKFNAGTYDVGEMLAGMGIDALDGVSLQWTFDEAQDIALSLRLALYVDTSAMNNVDDPGTYFLLDIKAEKDITLGRVIGADGSSVENYTIRAGESIISIYGREGYLMPGTVYVDLSGIDLLGLELPVISAQYAFTHMLINEFYDIIASIMDLGQYLEASYAMGENGNVTFSWDGTGLGNGPEVKYEVSVYGFDEDGVQYEVYSPAVTSATSVTANIGSAQYVSYTVNVASFFEYGPSYETVRRDLASHTTEISVVSSNEVAQLSYVTPDDVYAEEENAELARVENVKFTFTGAGTARVTWDAYEGALAYRIEVRRASDGGELTQESNGNFAWFEASGLTAMQIDVSGLFHAKDAFETAFTGGTQHPMVGAEGYDYGYIVTVYAYTDERIGEITESGDMTYAQLGNYKPVAVGAANSFETMSMWFAPRATEYMNGTTGYYSVGWNGVEGAASYSVLPYYVKRQVSASGMTVTYPVVGSVDKGGTALGLNDLSFAAEGRRSLTYYNVNHTSEYYVEAVAYDEYGNMIARGQITSGLGKISDTDKTLLPISTIEIVLDSERFGLELQLGAVLAILEGVGVELPIDLRGFDIDAALGLDTTLEATVVSDKIVEIEGDVDAVQLKGLADGDHTLTVEYTNSGNVTTRKSVSFTWTSGVVSNVKGDFDIGENGIVRQSMRRNGDYVFTLEGATSASAEFTTSRTLNLGITGDIVKPVSGAITVTNVGESKIGVTDDGRTLFWEPVANAVNYTVSVVLRDGEGGAILTERTFEGLEAFVQDVDFTARGYYEITVEAFGADGSSLGAQSANVKVTGDSGLGITIFIPYDEIVVGASDSAGEGEGAESYRDALKAYVDQKIENAENVNHNNYTKLLDLLEHYLSNFSLSLELGVESFTTEINLQTIINSVLGAVGVTTEIGAPIYINTDDIETMSVALNVSWSLNWDDPAASFATIELTYTGSDVTDKVLLGAYLYNNAVYVDLNGLGLFGLKLKATSLYEFLTSMIVDTIEGLFDGIDMGEGLDFSQAVTSLLGEYPELDLVAIAGASSQGVQAAALATADETAADESAAAESESAGGTDMTKIITGLLNAVSLNSTNVFVKANTAILDAITSTLLGVKLGVDLDLVLELPLLKGSIPAELRLDNITFDALLTIAALDRAPSVPANVIDDGNEEGGYFIDLDAEGTGAELLTALLGNLPLNLTVELANATMDSYAYYNYSPNNDWLGHGTYPAGTRIEIEVVQGSKTYGSNYNLASSFTASRGDIVVAVATTDKAEQDSSGGGYKRYLIVAHIDMDAGSLSVRLCERAIVLQAWAALGIVAEIDLGAGVSVLGGININIAAIPLNINIALDLADLLGGVLDGLLETINGLAGGADTASEASVPETTASGTGARVDGITAEFVTADGLPPEDGTQGGVQIRWQPAYQLNEDGTQGAEYDFYTVTVTNSRNGRIVQQLDHRSGSTDGGYYRIELNGTYYEAYEVSVVGGMDPSGFAAAFADLDIWKLLGGGQVKGNYNSAGEFEPSDTGSVVTTTGGIYMNLNSTGEMNLTIRFDPYEINKAVDALFGSIFGANSALDLTTASLGGSGTFGINYLAFMWWDRAGMSYRRLSGEPQGGKNGPFDTSGDNGTGTSYEDAHDTKAATDPTSTLDSLESQLRGLLADLLEQMNIAVDTAGAKLSGSYLRNRGDSLVWARWDDSPWGATPILLSIFMKFIPISIWNEAELNVNMTNGVLTNISFLGQDTGDAVLRYNTDSDLNDVYVYYAQTLYSKKTSGQYGSDNYGMQSNWTYNPFGYQVGYHVDMDGDGKPDTLNTPYKTTNSGTAQTNVAYNVYTYAIPYGSITDKGNNDRYYFQNVDVHEGTGAGGNDKGYGGRNPNAASGTVLYRRGDVVDPDTGNYTHGNSNQWSRGQNRDGDIATLESYTRIEIYNSMSNVSADNAYDNSAQNNGGVVSWGNIPNRIVYDPYSMGDPATAAAELWNDLFSQRGQLTARWQNGTTFQRRPIYFHMENGTEITRDNYQTVLRNALAAGNTFKMYAVAYFSSPASTARLNITVVPLQTDTGENDKIVSVDAWNLHYYDAIPEYVIVTTEGGQRKRYRVSRDKTEVDRGDADAWVQGIQTQGASYAQGYENPTASLAFRNGDEIRFTVNYLDSTLADPSITVDMYTISGEIVDGVETTAAQKIAAQIENLVLNYTDGDIATSETAITWGSGGELNENTPVSSEKYPEAKTLGEWLNAFENDESNINGDTIYLNATAAIDDTLLGGTSGGKGAFEQTLTVTVYIPSKQPNTINVHGAADNTVVLNPYDYYMYLVTGDDSYNPLPLNVDVTYASGESESVGVLWRGEDGKLKYADDYVTTWYTLPETHSREEGILKLQNDDTLYDFNWSGWNMAVQINSGVISGMRFLEDGEWKESPSKNFVSGTASVTFTSGHVLELPVVVRQSASGNSGYAYIGYNVDVYQRTGALVEYDGCKLKQSFRITYGA